MTGDATLDGVTAGVLGFLGLLLLFEIAAWWLRSSASSGTGAGPGD